MSSLLSAELSATCNALGTFDKRTGKYLIDEYTLNTVKDLIRYLRRDGEDHEIRIHFGQTKVLQTDLLPMLIDHWEKIELFDVTLRLLVNLTNPALLLYREEVPTERTARHNYLQILSHLQSYKEEAFSKVETWNVFAQKLAKVLEIEWNERDEDTGLIIERILILIRNVLHVPADLDHERRPENDASVHDQVLWALNQAGILDIILYMSSENEKQYFMHILEIITHLLREQNPTNLADAALQRSVDEKLRDEQELLSMRKAETIQRNNKIRQYSSTRHSRFGGTYVVQNMKSISDNEIICLKPLNKISNLDFGSGNKQQKFVKPKHRRPAESGTMERRSAFAVRLFLKEFCIEFLNGSYNPLMHYVKDVLVRAKAQQNDESYYLWAVKFFMEFNRGHNFQVGLVSETMSVPMFHYVQQQMEKYFDMIKLEKKKFSVWVRRLHLALRAYKELLNTLLAMEKSADTTVKESAKVLKSNIFYVLEYREFILHIFLSYDENKMPRSHLVDLIETVHLFLKMLEHFCKKTGLVVQKKIRKRAKSKKSAPPAPAPAPAPAWEAARAQLAAALAAPPAPAPAPAPAPFDAASDTPIDDQKENCVKTIQKLMREYKFENAIGLLRAAREVWPEGGIFGADGIAEDEELNMLETIYVADLGVETSEEVNSNNLEVEGEYSDADEEEEDAPSTAIVETDFNYQEFVQRFCHPRVVSACVFLLEQYDMNTPHTNHCIVKMLHRIAWDCKHPSMMFQASLFLIFQKILKDPSPLYKELEKFAIFTFKKFSEIASSNPKVFIELLFWKTTKETYEIEYGYEHYNDSKPGKLTWTEEQEEELRRLYMENQESPATDKDVIDWILENLIDQSRTRRGVIKKMKDLGLIFKAPTKKSNVREKVPRAFTENEDEMLKELWNTYEESNDPMAAIMDEMPMKRSKQSFIERLLQLGIIADKKQCHKKRSNKSNGRESSTINSDSSDNSEDDQNPDSPKPIVKTTRKDKKKTKKKTHKVLTASEIAKLLVEAVDSGLTEGLKWLIENLEEVALDQEAEGYDPEGEGVAIVPISKDAIDAMDSNLFQKVLKGVGVCPPVDEQESYWRIPSTLHFETLRKRKDIIIKAIDRTLVIEVDNNENLTEINDNINNKQESSEDDDDLFDNLRKNRENTAMETNDVVIDTSNKQRKRARSNEAGGDFNKSKMQKIVEAQSDDDEDALSFAKKTLGHDTELHNTEDILNHNPRRFYDESDDDNISDEEIVKTKSKNKRLIIDDDSD